jgi:thiosulfate reductase cytochrome b subunit
MIAPPTDQGLLERTPPGHEELLDGVLPDRRSSPRAYGTDRRRVARSPKAHLFVTVCHWSMVILLTVNLLSGMRIGWGYWGSWLGGPSGTWGTVLSALSPRGTLLGVPLLILHVTSACLVLLVAGVYVGYLIRSRTTARMRVTRSDLQKLWIAVRTGQFWRHKAALWSANVLVYWTSFLFVSVLVLTGVAMYRLDSGMAEMLGGYSLMRLVHAALAYLFLPLVVLHGVLQWVFGRFWTIFKAHLVRAHIRAGLISASLVLPVVVGVYLWDDRLPTLTVSRISPAQGPRLDGNPTDPVWTQAEAVVVRTVKGVNNPQDYVDVTIKSVHDGTQIYFLFQWDDPDVSLKRFPLQKTAQGWKVLQTAFDRADESVFYEDKLSVYLTDVPKRGCAATCHLGVGPHAARGEKHGVHYTSGEVGDVWHWKAVRTAPMGAPAGEPGYLDDQHFRGPDPVPVTLKPGERYTGGYHADPQPGGGYAYNFEKLDPRKPLAETFVRPKMLPARPMILRSADASESDHDAVWWLHKAQAIPYTPAADTYPVGALLPNIILEPFQGDRADVRGQAEWRVGRWTLEVRRVLDTRSKFDVAFSPDRPVYLSVAPYNRTQVQHGEHIRPVRVVLQP